jgi:hypothetical protein
MTTPLRVARRHAGTKTHEEWYSCLTRSLFVPSRRRAFVAAPSAGVGRAKGFVRFMSQPSARDKLTNWT